MSERNSQERLLNYVDATIERFNKLEGYRPSTIQLQGYLRDAYGVNARQSDIARCAEIVYEDRQREERLNS